MVSIEQACRPAVVAPGAGTRRRRQVVRARRERGHLQGGGVAARHDDHTEPVRGGVAVGRDDRDGGGRRPRLRGPSLEVCRGWVRCALLLSFSRLCPPTSLRGE